MRIVKCYRYHAVLGVPPRGVHGKEATVSVWVGCGWTFTEYPVNLYISLASAVGRNGKLLTRRKSTYQVIERTKWVKLSRNAYNVTESNGMLIKRKWFIHLMLFQTEWLFNQTRFSRNDDRGILRRTDIITYLSCYCDADGIDITYRSYLVSIDPSTNQFTALTLFCTGAITSFVNRVESKWLEQQLDQGKKVDPAKRRYRWHGV